MSQDAIISTIQKLLRKGQDKNIPKAEAESFLAKAMEMMHKHNISRVTVESAEKEANKPDYKIVEKAFHTGRQRYETDQYIARILRNCFCVSVLWGTDWDYVTTVRNGRTFENLKQRVVYYLYGDQLDVEMAEMVIKELHPMMRHFLARHLHAEGMVWNAKTCHSFFDGFTCEYVELNSKAKEQACLESGVSAANQYALVVKGKEEATKDYIKQNVVTVRARTVLGPKSGGYDHRAFAAGKEKGRNIKLGTKKLT